MTTTGQTAETGSSARDDVDSGLVLLALQAQAADRRKLGWIKRRVEQLQFLDTRAVLWRVSIDFEVPPEAPAVHIGPQTLRLVPVTTLPKGDLVAFDLRDECGTALWMPTAEETNRRIAPAMVVRARRVLRQDSLPGNLATHIMKIVATSPADHESAYRPFAAAVARIDADLRTADLRAASERLTAARFWRVRERWRAQRTWNRAQDAAVRAGAARRAAECKLGGLEPDVIRAAYDLMSDVRFRSQLEELSQNYLV